MTDQPTNQQLDLDAIEARVNAARHCPNAEANGRLDGQHTLSGSFSHIRCELCTYSRPRGERVEETAVLLAEVRRLRAEPAVNRAQAWRDLADRADPAHEASWFGDFGHMVGGWIRQQAEYEARAAAVPAVETGR